jgi:hypothetical protein
MKKMLISHSERDCSKSTNRGFRFEESVREQHFCTQLRVARAARELTLLGPGVQIPPSPLNNPWRDTLTRHG